MRWTPRVTVSCIVEDQDKLLFVEEMSRGKVVLNQPSGHIEKHEDLMQAAIRETLEESGCEVEVSSILGLYQHHTTHNDITYFRVCFHTKLIDKYKSTTLDSGIIRTLWLTPEKALAQQDRFRSPLVKAGIEDYLKGVSYPLELLKNLPTS